jgi:hypothetical protein
MRKIIILTAVLMAFSVNAWTADFAPYYNYQFTEGVSVSPEGQAGFLVNLSNDIGAIFKPVKSQSFIAFYSLKYQGPGLKQQEGQEFSERYLDHIFVGRHHLGLPGGMTLKSQLDLMFEGRRAGTNENWENGLYNFNRYGGGSSLEFKTGPFAIEAGLKYHMMKFPNYTDLLQELRSGADASASEGQQDQNLIELGGKIAYGVNTARANFGMQAYSNQKVVTDSVQNDSSYYSSTRQKDINISASLSRDQIVGGFLELVPEISIGMKNSNQNYQHFESETSTVPVSFHPDFNDYTTVDFSIPITLALTKKWSFILNPHISYKTYGSRLTRNVDGDFSSTGETQNRMLSIITAGFKNQIGESSYSMLFGTYQQQTSNMEFERFVLYNYDAFSVGFQFGMEY